MPNEDPIKNVQDAVRSETAPKPERRVRSAIFQAVLLVVAVGFGILAATARYVPYLPIDLSISRFVQSFHQDWVIALMSFFSFFGYSIQAIITTGLIGILLYTLGLQWEAVVAVLAAVFSFLVDDIVKIIVHRARPAANLIDVIRQVTGFSFPSGHVMFYVGLFGFLLYLEYTLLKHSWRRTLLLIATGLLIVMVGPSRIYLGAHWPSDVLGAYMLGSLVLLAIIRFYRWGKTRYFVRQPVASEGERQPQSSSHSAT